MPRSVFYYQKKNLLKPDKYLKEKEEIQRIWDENKGRYGYLRITSAMKKRGYKINHKTVEKLEKAMGLQCKIRKKKYKSYKGEVGKVAKNILNRDFKADKPMQKLVTDVSEFKVGNEKLYLSQVVDLFNGEIISAKMSKYPNFKLIMDTLNETFKGKDNVKGTILHSDQGWAYQMPKYQDYLKKKGIIQSMSRKGNCLDNSIAENTFGIGKTEFFYKESFKNINDAMKGYTEYVKYYNNERIRLKLNGMSPVEYRKVYEDNGAKDTTDQSFLNLIKLLVCGIFKSAYEKTVQLFG